MKDLTKREQGRVLAVLRMLRIRLGRLRKLADALGFSEQAVMPVLKERRPPSAVFALRVARIAGVPVEDILSGAYPPPGTCPRCGYCASDFPEEDTTP
jgi:transcriptional regulator with XRE-family HTH domain